MTDNSCASRSEHPILYHGDCTSRAAGLSFWSRLTTPSDGSFINPEELMLWTAGDVATLREGTIGALRPGDRVVGVEGRTIASWMDNLLNIGVKRPNLAIGTTLTYQVQRAGHLLEVPVTFARYPLAAKVSHNWSLVLFVLEFIVLATFVFARRPGDPAARAALLVASFATCAATLWMSSLEVGDLVTATGSWRYLLGETADAIAWGTSLHFVLIFPRPWPVLTRHPWLVWLVYTAPLIVCGVQLVAALLNASGDLIRLWASSLMLMQALLYPIAMLVALAYRYRSLNDAAVRQQLRWLVLTLGAGLVLYLMIWIVPMQVIRYPLLPWGFQFLVFLPAPVAVALAILRYQAFDIKVVINRALAYGFLTVCVVAVFETTIGLLGMLFEKRVGFVISLIITGLLTAVLFDPLRERLQGSVSRLYGQERDDPYQVLSLGQRLDAARAPADVRMAVVEIVTQALRVPYAAIELKCDDGFYLAAVYGTPAGELLHLPLTYQGETIGRLVLAPPGPAQTFSPIDHQLLEDVGRQAGIAIHAARLTADLQRSRQRLITALHDEEARCRHGEFPDGLQDSCRDDRGSG